VAVFLLCFSIDDQNSYRNISYKWQPEILKYNTQKAPVILLGLKKGKDFPSSLKIMKQFFICRFKTESGKGYRSGSGCLRGAREDTGTEFMCL